MLQSFHQHSIGRQNQLHSTSGVTSSLAAQASFDLGNAALGQHHAQGMLFAAGHATGNSHHVAQLTSPPKLG